MTEAVLTHNLMHYLPLLLAAHGRRADSRMVVAEEFACGEGVADIVVGLLPDAGPTNWSAAGWAVLESVTGAAVLRSLNRRAPLSPHEIAGQIGMTTRTARRYIDRLVDAGLACRRNGGFVGSHSVRDMPPTEIWAFEAKLFDWRRALYQALRYRAFSQYSVVVMPESCLNGAFRSKCLFRQFGVGLLAVADADGASFVIRPRRRRPRSAAIHLAAAAKLQSCAALSRPTW
jgi:DNA-binding transcriptional ArsR family regulator